MSDLKTKETDADVEAFLNGVDDPGRREDCFTLLRLFREETGHEPRMWGASMVGFGRYRYKYESGREGVWFAGGFSPRKANLTLYLIPGFDRFAELLARLGKHKTGKGCLYVKRLSDVDSETLKQLVRESVAHIRKTYEALPETSDS